MLRETLALRDFPIFGMSAEFSKAIYKLSDHDEFQRPVRYVGTPEQLEEVRRLGYAYVDSLAS